MSLDTHSRPREIDESSWVYLAAHHRDRDVGASHPFQEMLTEACERQGFSVFATSTADNPEQASSPHWPDAVSHAEVCVIYLGAASAAAGAELAMAYCSGRPVIALRSHDDPIIPALAAITRHYAALREVVFADAEDCVVQLSKVLADPEWQQLVRRSAAIEDF